MELSLLPQGPAPVPERAPPRPVPPPLSAASKQLSLSSRDSARQAATSLSVQLLPVAQTARPGPVLLLPSQTLSFRKAFSVKAFHLTIHLTAPCGGLVLLMSQRSGREASAQEQVQTPCRSSASATRLDAHLKTRHSRHVNMVAQKNFTFQNTFLSRSTYGQWLAVSSEDPEPDKLSIEVFTHWDRPHLHVTTKKYRCPHTT